MKSVILFKVIYISQHSKTCSISSSTIDFVKISGHSSIPLLYLPLKASRQPSSSDKQSCPHSPTERTSSPSSSNSSQRLLLAFSLQTSFLAKLPSTHLYIARMATILPGPKEPHTYPPSGMPPHFPTTSLARPGKLVRWTRGRCPIL